MRETVVSKRVQVQRVGVQNSDSYGSGDSEEEFYIRQNITVTVPM